MSTNEWFEKHVVDSLERLEQGQDDMVKTFTAHTESDNRQFEAIRTAQAVSNSERAAEIRTSARFWSAISAGIGFVASTILHFLFKGH